MVDLSKPIVATILTSEYKKGIGMNNERNKRGKKKERMR